MDFNHVREFNVLARTLNFSTAAKELYLSQPTLSKHMTALESELGFALLTRQPTVALTEAGSEFYRRSAPLLEHVWNELSSIAASAKRLSVNAVTLRVPDYTGAFTGYVRFVNEVKALFDGRFAPKVLVLDYVPLQSWRQLSLEECLKGEVLDYAFVFGGPDSTAEAVARRLGDDMLEVFRGPLCPIGVVTKRDDRLAQMAAPRLSDLDGRSFFTHNMSHLETSSSVAFTETLSRRGAAVRPKTPYYSTDRIDVWGHVKADDEVFLAFSASLMQPDFVEQREYVEVKLADGPLALRGFGVYRRDLDPDKLRAVSVVRELAEKLAERPLAPN